MKYEIKRTSQFKKDYKSMVKRSMKMSELNAIIDLLAEGTALPSKNRIMR